MKLISILISLILSGCTTSQSNKNILYTAFPELRNSEYAEAHDVKFISGPWYSPNSEYGYIIEGESALMAYFHNEEIVSFKIEGNCFALAEAKNKMRDAIIESTGHMVEPKQTSEEIVVLDGPRYELYYSDIGTSTKYKLSGGGTAKYATNWVSAAFSLGEALIKCKK